MSEPAALAGALDQPRDVRHHEAVGVLAGHAQVGRERREGIVGDLGLRGREPGEQRGLPRVRQSHQADVGDRAQLHREGLGLAGLARLGRCGEPGSAGRRRPRCRAHRARRGHDGPRALPDQVGEQASIVEDHRAVGHGRTRSLPEAPSRLVLRPASPCLARWWGCSASQERSCTPRITSKITEPPSPPLPPSGPPRGLYGSLCRCAEPLPPRPASAKTVHSSTNAMHPSLGGRPGAGRHHERHERARTHHGVDGAPRPR